MSQYCTPADLLGTGINPIALVNVPTGTQADACIRASERADSYMRGRFALPLLAWGADVKQNTAYLAIYMLLVGRGYNPEGADTFVRQNYEDAIHWFEGIQTQRVHPDVTPAVAQPGDPVHDVPQVFTTPMRGWTRRAGMQRVG